MDEASRAVFAAAVVHYLPAGGARAAAVLAADAVFSAVLAERTVLLRQVLPYRPGEFFLRELPPLQAVLAGIPRLGLLIIDGYADLDPAGRPGLGAHAHAAFGVPVIGVAKTQFRTAIHAVEVLRGRPARLRTGRPLTVIPLDPPVPGSADGDCFPAIVGLGGRARIRQRDCPRRIG